MMLATLIQLSADSAAQFDRIGDALVVMAWAVGIVGAFSVIAILVSLYTLRSATKLMNSAQHQINRLAPRTEPLIDKLTRVADDARDVTDVVRRRVKDLMDNVADLSGVVKNVRIETEKRVREFGAVVDVVQSEAENLLLDAASTAHGVHVAAARLRGVGPSVQEEDLQADIQFESDEYEDDDYEDDEEDEYEDDEDDEDEEDFDDDEDFLDDDDEDVPDDEDDVDESQLEVELEVDDARK